MALDSLPFCGGVIPFSQGFLDVGTTTCHESSSFHLHFLPDSAEIFGKAASGLPYIFVSFGSLRYFFPSREHSRRKLSERKCDLSEPYPANFTRARHNGITVGFPLRFSLSFIVSPTVIVSLIFRPSVNSTKEILHNSSFKK